MVFIKIMRFNLWWIFLLVFVFASCESQEAKIQRYLDDLIKKIPENELIKFANNIETQYKENNIHELNQYFDEDALHYRGLLSIKDQIIRLHHIANYMSIDNSIKQGQTLFVELKSYFSTLNFLDFYIDSSGFDVLVFQAEGIQQFVILEITVAKINNSVKIIDYRSIHSDGCQSEIIYEYAISIFEASQKNIHIEGYITEINQLLKEGKYQDAQNIYDEIPQVVKKDNKALDMTLLNILQFTNFKIYSKLIEKKITQIKYKPTKLVQSYLINVANNNYEEAIINLNELSLLYPTASVFTNQLGHMYFHLHMPDIAINYYLKSIELEPQIKIYKNSLSSLYLEQAMYKEALEIYTELLEDNYIEIIKIDEYIKKSYPEFHKTDEYNQWKLNNNLKY
jgi:tetratricopeptide (TPR) repeat protein